MDGNEIRAEVIEEKETTNEKKSFKEKAKDVFESGKRTVGNGWNWCMNHKADIFSGILMAGGAVKVMKDAGFIKPATQRAAEDRDKIYDPHSGIYYNLRRRLTTSEKIELERRSRDGEGYGEILSSMGVLTYR